MGDAIGIELEVEAQERGVGPFRADILCVDVPVIVDESKCLEKCTACIEVCSLDVLAKNLETGKAYMKYDECWFCLLCEKECLTGAITVQTPCLLR